MAHKFTIGQAVELTRTMQRPAIDGDYEIVRLMPASDADPDNHSYRVKNIAEKHERVVRESEMTLSRRPESVLS